MMIFTERSTILHVYTVFGFHLKLCLPYTDATWMAPKDKMPFRKLYILRGAQREQHVAVATTTG